VQWKWANRFDGAGQFLYSTMGLTLVAPGNTVQDINDSFVGQMLSGERLVPQTMSVEPKVLGLDFAIPVFFLQGAEDFTTPAELAPQYLASIKAPKKKFVLLKGGGHFAVFMNSGQFLRVLDARVRPLALKR
jgi:pimeloyl-ACP methyl ester carboxylesterase